MYLLFFSEDVVLIHTDYTFGQFPIHLNDTIHRVRLPRLDASPIREGSAGNLVKEGSVFSYLHDPEDISSRWLCAIQIQNLLMVCNTQNNVSY